MRRRLVGTTVTALALTAVLGGCAEDDEGVGEDEGIVEEEGLEEEPVE